MGGLHIIAKGSQKLRGAAQIDHGQLKEKP